MWNDEAEEVSDEESASSSESEPPGIWLGSEDSDCRTDDDSYESSFVVSDTGTESEGEGYGSGWSLADECARAARRVPSRRRAVVHSDSASDAE